MPEIRYDLTSTSIRHTRFYTWEESAFQSFGQTIKSHLSRHVKQEARINKGIDLATGSDSLLY
ncbi:hypothetical protein [Desulfopila sp. IMCC35008]|uniref:hypothetical protein n=1 Tax=Desulfopila sp. IMCC35008 TaxID=2653858 RepID=UPI0013D7405F|nr:hypothetical protein [Desulfopila sp. IMCC35008]